MDRWISTFIILYSLLRSSSLVARKDSTSLSPITAHVCWSAVTLAMWMMLVARLTANAGARPSSCWTVHSTRPSPRQADGFTLASFAGYALEHYPPIHHGFGRLLPTGELDGTFDPIASFNPNGPLGPNFISTGFTPFADGTLLVAGSNGVTADYGKLLPDGTEDPSFQGDPNITFATAIPCADGKIVLSQYDPTFNDPNLLLNPNAQAAVDGTDVRRINSTGPLDGTFNLDPAILADTQVRDGNGNLTDVYVGSEVLAVAADNTILFGYLSKDGSYHLVRLNDGSLVPPPSFQGQTFPVQVSY